MAAQCQRLLLFARLQKELKVPGDAHSLPSQPGASPAPAVQVLPRSLSSRASGRCCPAARSGASPQLAVAGLRKGRALPCPTPVSHPRTPSSRSPRLHTCLSPNGRDSAPGCRRHLLRPRHGTPTQWPLLPPDFAASLPSLSPAPEPPGSLRSLLKVPVAARPRPRPSGISRGWKQAAGSAPVRLARRSAAFLPASGPLLSAATVTEPPHTHTQRPTPQTSGPSPQAPRPLREGPCRVPPVPRGSVPRPGGPAPSACSGG